jgi:hypothetical protein
MPREITDDDGIAWSCVQAFAGLGNDGAKTDAARVDGSDRLRVVCTPRGGATSVRLELAEGWETSMSDAALRRAIEAELNHERTGRGKTNDQGRPPHPQQKTSSV